jgi:uncharacterized membrane protein
MAQLESFDEFILSVVRDAWGMFRRDALLFVLAGAVWCLLAGLTFGLLAGPLAIGFIDLVRRSRQGEPVALGTLFSRFDAFVPSLVASIVIVIGVALGMLLLVVPGLLVSLFSTYTMHGIAYERLGGIEAIRRSIQLVRTNMVPTLAVVLVLWCLQAVGGVIVIALLVTTPLALIILTLAYERIERSEVRPGLVMEP